jgi:hypothetical protein
MDLAVRASRRCMDVDSPVDGVCTTGVITLFFAA